MEDENKVEEITLDPKVKEALASLRKDYFSKKEVNQFLETVDSKDESYESLLAFLKGKIFTDCFAKQWLYHVEDPRWTDLASLNSLRETTLQTINLLSLSAQINDQHNLQVSEEEMLRIKNQTKILGKFFKMKFEEK